MGETRTKAQYLMAHPVSAHPNLVQAFYTGVPSPDMSAEDLAHYIIMRLSGIHESVLMLADKIDELRTAVGLGNPQTD